jgi:hypothetical protein
VLESSAAIDFTEALQERIEADILPGLRPVSPVPSVLRVVVALLACLILVIVVQNWRLGLAGWHARNALQAAVNFILIGASVLALANLLGHQMTPGARRRGPMLLYLALPVLGLTATDVALFGYHYSPDFVPLAISCWEIGVACAALCAPLFWLALRRGVSLNPVAHGATAGLLAGLAGVTVLEVYCPYLDRLHITAGHIGAAVTAMLAGAALGAIQRRVQRHRP